MRVRAVPTLLCAALAAAGALTTLGARAETIVVNDKVSVRESDIARPHRGMRMEQVEHQFGAPETKHPTVGKPPITRWDYGQFSVFFEGDRVIHTVVAGERPAAAGEHPSGGAHPASGEDHPAGTGEAHPSGTGEDHPAAAGEDHPATPG